MHTIVSLAEAKWVARILRASACRCAPWYQGALRRALKTWLASQASYPSSREAALTAVVGDRPEFLVGRVE